MNKPAKKKNIPTNGGLITTLSNSIDKIRKLVVVLFFVIVWALLAFYDAAGLFRISDLSHFLFDEVYFYDMMSVPAGFLMYISSFLVQFFHYPILGATIYVILLFIVFWLTVKVFDIPKKYNLLALVPVVALIASNTQLGYWIFYIKLPGYYYIALLATIALLLVLSLFKRLKVAWRIVLSLLWLPVGYPLFGAYALFGSVLMILWTIANIKSAKDKKWLHKLFVIISLLAICLVPYICYYIYSTVALGNLYMVGLPYTQWVSEYVKNVQHDNFLYWHWIYLYWIPYILLFLSFSAFLVAKKVRRLLRMANLDLLVMFAVVGIVVIILSVFWYNDKNYRIENKQNMAMWNEQWRQVADYAKESEVPTRQIVMNKNLALLKLGAAGNEMFSYPDGSSSINSPMVVHLTQTGGKMTYYQYGKFNFCYRWCVEDAVEYGWRYEYLKHAVRSMLLSGEYRLAQRYINILKRTIFYRSWAKDMERFVENPDLINKERKFYMPLQMACFHDALDLDESFVEAFLTKNFSNIPENATPLYIETALTAAMIRKDMKAFWFAFDQYLKVCNPQKLPRHYQEAVLLFMNLDKGQTVTIGDAFMERYIAKSVQRRLASFVDKTKRYKNMKEEEMASHFEDYADTYFYFYFFVRKIKTN